ncbi:unnamed protein product [Heligmosomoides polygyrus]|uniref:DDE_3 domain-containing protein n=1 Tax=Heligmosomoides polygyrus TaxID=6339 RepID=A0A183FLH0_HELPZ|nr:unnamed protein product [Heligmosomoides polygyrus]
MNSKAMVNEIEEMGQRLALIHSLRFKKVLLFDNAAPHREEVSTDKLGQRSYVHTVASPTVFAGHLSIRLPLLLEPTGLPSWKGHKNPSSP